MRSLSFSLFRPINLHRYYHKRKKIIWQSFIFCRGRCIIHFMNLNDVWTNALRELELEIPRAGFAAWFRQAAIESFNNGVLMISVPSLFAKEWFEKHYHSSITTTLSAALPNLHHIEYSIKKNSHPIIPQEAPITNIFVNQKDGLNPKYAFETFIVGSFNELAHAAAVAVTESPGLTYNPLFVYGGVGLGKTHLLQAIGNEIKTKKKEKNVLYTTSERFISEFISLIQQRQPLASFKEKYRGVDVLLIDDIQFFAGKTKCQEELFHTFNTLHERNKQIVFTSDQPPHIIPDLEERLRSRFAAGLIADISDPEPEARLAIISQKAKEKDILILQPVLEYISLIFQRNIRELEGVVTAIIAHSRMRKTPLSFEEAKHIIDQCKAQTKKSITATEILQTVARMYEINEQDLSQRTRRKEVVVPRQVAMYLLRNDFNASLSYIGKKFGGRDHTTVMYACKKMSHALKTDKQLGDMIKKIRAHLEGTSPSP